MRNYLRHGSFCALILSLAAAVLAQDRTQRVEKVLGDIEQLAFALADSAGRVRIVNTANRPLISIRGTYDFPLPTGGIKLIRWTNHVSDPLGRPGRQGVAPLDSVELPPTVDPDGNLVPYRNLRLTGLLFDDGATAGPDGPFLRDLVRAMVKARLAQLVEARQFLREDAEGFLERLLGNDPVIQGRDSWVVHRTLQSLLLNPERTQLKPECHAILAENLKRLEAF